MGPGPPRYLHAAFMPPLGNAWAHHVSGPGRVVCCSSSLTTAAITSKRKIHGYGPGVGTGVPRAKVMVYPIIDVPIWAQCQAAISLGGKTPSSPWPRRLAASTTRDSSSLTDVASCLERLRGNTICGKTPASALPARYYPFEPAAGISRISVKLA